MDKDAGVMLKKVIIYDLVILLLALIISALSFREYMPMLVIGLVIALANFILNALMTNYTVRLNGGRILLIVGTVGRVAFTAVVAILLCKNNIAYFVAFLLGYSLHYISVIIYGIGQMTHKRRVDS